MKSLMIALSAALVLGTSAFAADHKDRNGPCKDDGARFCSGKTWGKGLGKCLKGHEAELSPACKAKLAEKMQDRKDLKENHEHEAEAKSEKGEAEE
ncbi:MAG: hypothetical protein H7222_17300 [Methylotenera sp.]|nr:hypothetical protein [Oligoflexia bacterium]